MARMLRPVDAKSDVFPPMMKTHPLLGLSAREWSTVRNGLLFISPWVFGFIAFALWPILSSLYYSFTKFDGVTTPTWVGLYNYQQLATDPEYFTAISNTLYYIAIYLPAATAVSLGLALLLNQERRGIAVYRTLFFIPSLVPFVASAAIWLWVFSPEYGLMNQLLHLIGIPPQAWLQATATVKPALIIISVWQIGGSMVIYLAGLKEVPVVLYDAASVDGASRLRKFWHITIPMLSPVIFFNVVIGFIGSLQYFTQALVLTGQQGDPMQSALFYVTDLYDWAFAHYSMGYASAMAWVLFAATSLCTLILFGVGSRFVYYGGHK